MTQEIVSDFGQRLAKAQEDWARLCGNIDETIDQYRQKVNATVDYWVDGMPSQVLSWQMGPIKYSVSMQLVPEVKLFEIKAQALVDMQGGVSYILKDHPPFQLPTPVTAYGIRLVLANISAAFQFPKVEKEL